MKPKRKQRVKKGKVVRLAPETWSFISFHQNNNETIANTIKRLIQPPTHLGRSYYILPETGIVCTSRAEAKGVAIMTAVKRGRKTLIEEPIEVKEVVK